MGSLSPSQFVGYGWTSPGVDTVAALMALRRGIIPTGKRDDCARSKSHSSRKHQQTWNVVVRRRVESRADSHVIISRSIQHSSCHSEHFLTKTNSFVCSDASCGMALELDVEIKGFNKRSTAMEGPRSDAENGLVLETGPVTHSMTLEALLVLARPGSSSRRRTPWPSSPRMPTVSRTSRPRAG